MEEMMASTGSAIKSVRFTGATALLGLSAGWAASVPVLLGETIAIYAAPHFRGVAFFPALRYAIAFPVCVVATISLVFLYRAFEPQLKRPRRSLAVLLLGFVLLVCFVSAIFGTVGFAIALVPALLASALAASFFVPYFANKLERPVVVAVLICTFGLLEIAAFGGSLRSEPIFSPGAERIDFDVPRATFDAEQRFIDLPPGLHIHYVDEGHGPTLLFLHGNPAWSFQWHDLINDLHSTYRCVALDYPGFGMSNAPAGFGYTPEEESQVVEQFADKLQLRDITLVMQDWGGPIGLSFAERRPELIRSLILGSTWAWRTDPNSPRGKFSRIFGGPVGEFIQMNFPAIVSVGLKQDVHRQLEPETVRLYQRPFLPPNRRAIASFYPGQITVATSFFTSLESALPKLRAKPALIFLSFRDPGFSHEELKRWDTVFPKHQTIDVPNGGHYFFEDEPDRILSAIRAFMAEGSKGPSRS